MIRSILPVLVVLLLIIVSTSNAINSRTISEICSKTSDPSECLEYFKVDIFAASGDLKHAGKTILDNAIRMSSFFIELTKRETEPQLKQRWYECLRSYEKAIENLGKAKQFLEADVLKDVKILVSAAQTDVKGCHFEGATIIVMRMKEVSTSLIDIAGVIFNML